MFADGVTRRLGPGRSRRPARVAIGRRCARVLVVAAALCLVPTTAASATPTDSTPAASPLERVQALVQPAVVYEEITFTSYVYDEYNKHRFRDDPFTVTYQCTGFVVSPDGYIATAGHCVDFDQSVKDAILDQVAEWAFDTDYYEGSPTMEVVEGEKSNWRTDGAKTEGTPDLTVSVAYGVSASGEPSGKALPARLVSKRAFDQGDVALLKIDAKDLTVIPLSENAKTGVGTQVVAVGYPASVDLVTDASFNPSFKEGAISAEKTVSGGLLPVYEISAAVSGGMSGGPTVGLDGQVIGVNSFKIVGESQPFNFVQPAQNLQELIRAEGVSQEPGEVTTLYRKGLDAYFSGDKETATNSFRQVLEIVPNHQFAQEYQRKTRSLPDRSVLGSPVLWMGLGALLLVGAALAIGLMFLLRRKRPVAAVVASGDGPSGPPAVPPPATSSFPPAYVPPPPATSTPPPPPSGAPTVAMPQQMGAGHEAVEDVANAERSTPTTMQPTTQPTPGDRFCPGCGRGHEADEHFCPGCGHRFD